MEFFIQTCVTILIAIIEFFLNKKMDKTFDKEKYCKNYLTSLQITNQNNNARTGDIRYSNVNIQQSNVSNVNTYINRDSSSSPNSGIEIVIIYLVVTLITMALFIFAFGYLKFNLYLDYWYPMLLLLLASISLLLYNHNVSKNPELYWERKQHFSAILLLFIFFIVFSYFLFQDVKTIEILDHLKVIVTSNDDTLPNLTRIFEIFDSNNMLICYFASKVILIFIPLGFLCLDIYNQIRYKKPLLDIMFISIIIAGVIILQQFLLAN